MLSGTCLLCEFCVFRMRERCGASCTSGSMMGEDGHCGGVHASPYSHSATIGRPATAAHTPTSQLDPLHPGVTNRGSVVSTTSSASKPSAAFINITGFMAPDSTPKETLGQRVQVRAVKVSFCYVSQ